MHHSFDINIAQKFGVNVAIFLNNLSFWIQKNKANERHCYDGRFWTYNSQAAFLKLFPYWSRKTLRTTIESAQKHELIIQGNYNKLSYDKTTWYALSDIGLSLFPTLNAPEPSKKLIGRKRPIDMPESANGSAENGQPIPDSKPDSKPDNIISDSEESQKTKSKNNKEDIQPIIDIWNEVAVLQGCPKQGTDKRSIQEIKRNIKIINEQWEFSLTPNSFRKWLEMAIDLKFYLVTKPGYMMPLKVILRWEHFFQAYNNYLYEINNNDKDRR